MLLEVLIEELMLEVQVGEGLQADRACDVQSEAEAVVDTQKIPTSLRCSWRLEVEVAVKIGVETVPDTGARDAPALEFDDCRARTLSAE